MNEEHTITSHDAAVVANLLRVMLVNGHSIIEECEPEVERVIIALEEADRIVIRKASEDARDTISNSV